MRNTLHVLLSLAMWCLFGYYWSVVLGRDPGPAASRALVVLAVTVAAGLAVTALWIRHNLRLARKFAGRRRTVRPAAPIVLDQDTIGREVAHPGLDLLTAADIVDIHADDTSKTYTPVSCKVPV